MTDRMTGDTTGGDGSADERYTLPTPNLSVFGDAPKDAPAPTPTPPPTPGGPPGRPGGGVRFQDASTARPRPPSLAEQRARQQAEAGEAEAQAEAQQQRFAAAGRSRRRRLLGLGIGVVVIVILVAGAMYLLSPPTVTARCVGADGGTTDTVTGDQYCDQAYVTSHGGYVQNGLIFLPIGNGLFRHYRYYYGGTMVGNRVTGGSFTVPSRATIKTGSGGTIQRGGFGVPGGGSGGSSGGKSGSKGGSSGGRSGGGRH